MTMMMSGDEESDCGSDDEEADEDEEEAQSESDGNADEVYHEDFTFVSENEDNTNAEKYNYLDAFCQFEMEEDYLVS